MHDLPIDVRVFKDCSDSLVRAMHSNNNEYTHVQLFFQETLKTVPPEEHYTHDMSLKCLLQQIELYPASQSQIPRLRQPRFAFAKQKQELSEPQSLEFIVSIINQ